MSSSCACSTAVVTSKLNLAAKRQAAVYLYRKLRQGDALKFGRAKSDFFA
jgi:hypothetical protein